MSHLVDLCYDALYALELAPGMKQYSLQCGNVYELDWLLFHPHPLRMLSGLYKGRSSPDNTELMFYTFFTQMLLNSEPAYTCKSLSPVTIFMT